MHTCMGFHLQKGMGRIFVPFRHLSWWWYFRFLDCLSWHPNHLCLWLLNLTHPLHNLDCFSLIKTYFVFVMKFGNIQKINIYIVFIYLYILTFTRCGILSFNIRWYSMMRVWRLVTIIISANFLIFTEILFFIGNLLVDTFKLLITYFTTICRWTRRFYIPSLIKGTKTYFWLIQCWSMRAGMRSRFPILKYMG